MAAYLARSLATLGAVALMTAGCSGDPTPTDSPTAQPTQPSNGDTPTETAPQSTQPEVTPTAATPTAPPASDRCEGNVFTPPATGTCEVTSGSDTLLLQGDVMLPDGILEAGEVLVVDDAILCVGCDCHDEAQAAGATKITCAEGMISPGLINAHDHIGFTEGVPIDHGTTRYDHRHEWRAALSTPSNANALGDAWGEMRQVITGTTSLFGSGVEQGFLRNLDRSSGFEGLDHLEAEYDTFPLGDSDRTTAEEGCSAYDIDPVEFDDFSAYVPHVSEGINAAARNEFLCLSGLQEGGVDYVTESSSFIHGIGVWSSDIGLMAEEGTALVWSPRSNTDLYGMTAEVPTYARLGAQIGLGTDWTYSGSVSMLRELACAESWSDTYWNGAFSDKELVAMATHQAAEVLGFSDTLGSLVTGKVADITIWNAAEHSGYRAILDASPGDVALVLRGGLPLYGDAGILEGLGEDSQCELLQIDGATDVCGAPKRICAEREIGQTAASLAAELGDNVYGLYFCGTPDSEPSCTPLRPGEFDGQATTGDRDGDGIANDSDNCPDYFNPPRPVDGDAQADFDSDGVGDICDPCPLDADTTVCTAVDPNDVDGDGTPNSTDNCQDVPNADQADGDEDGRGDVCDACPDDYNPGGQPCPFSIYDIKTEIIGDGSGAFVGGAIVTASVDDAFFMTTDPASDDYDGAEYGSIYVYNAGADQPAIGSQVNVAGLVNHYFGQIQLEASDVTVIATDVTVPDPAVIDDPSTIAPDGLMEQAFEGGLVTVEDVEVLDDDPQGADGERNVENELIVTGGLTVDDQIYLIEPFPVEGQIIPSITGVLRYTWERNKLLPRDEGDVDLGAPTVATFGPDTALVYAGDTGETSPAIIARLTIAPDEALFVPVTSDDESVLTVVDGGVTFAAGELEASLEVTGVAAGGPVTVTIDPAGAALTAEITVLADDTLPVPIALEPAIAEMNTESALTLTVELDLPAQPAGQEVEITLVELERGDVTPTPVADTPTLSDETPTPVAATATPTVIPPTSTLAPTGTPAPGTATEGTPTDDPGTVPPNNSRVVETPTPTADDGTLAPTTPTATLTPTAAPTPTAGGTPTQEPSDAPLLTAPLTVTVPGGQTTATFDVTSGLIPGVVEVTASANGESVTTVVTISAKPIVGLLLSEAFPNPASTDNDKEWVKLYNGTGNAIDLSTWSLGYGGGSYTRFTTQLQGTIEAGGCFIVGGPISDESNGEPDYGQVSTFAGNLQNSGDDADAIGLFNVVATAIESDTLPVDTLLYGGANNHGFLDPEGNLAVPQVDGAPSGQSITRLSLSEWTYGEPNAVECREIQ